MPMKRTPDAIGTDVNYVGESFEELIGVVELQAEALFQRQRDGSFQETSTEAQFGDANGKLLRRIVKKGLGIGVKRKPQATAILDSTLQFTHARRIASEEMARPGE